MITYEKARQIAQGHLDSEQPPNGAKWVLIDGVAVEDGWFFSYSYTPVPSYPEAGTPETGEAPGFIVSHATGALRAIPWEEFYQIMEDE